MCGIVGGFLPRDLGASEIEAAVKSIEHRGPDEQASWSDENAFLGICRLSIIDLAGGSQPIWNEDETKCIVYNGELYNFRDLRPQLESKGHKFKTSTDTEVVLHAYEEWGADCLTHFNGMFGLAIYDVKTQSMFVARDRIGEKPLYYFRAGETLLFASEIKALLQFSVVPREVSEQGLTNFLSYGHSVAPDTMYKGIKKLLPGHYMLATREGEEVGEYWDIDAGSDDYLTGDETEVAESVLSLLEDSVQRRMIADVPVGAFLSGGVDSSAIASLMTRHASGSVKTFSLGFEVGGAYNELSDARQVANYLGTDHHELVVTESDLVDKLKTLVYHYDEPFGDPAGFPVLLLSEAARRDVKVVLTGDGGDELFGGYRRYAVDRFSRAYGRIPDRIASGVHSASGRLPRLRRIKRTLGVLPVKEAHERYPQWLELFSKDLQEEVLKDQHDQAVADHRPYAVYEKYFSKASGNGDHLNQLMYVDLKTWLPDTYMEKVDKTTMAASLEGRLPLLDHRLAELAFRIPGKMKIKGRSMKKVLKDAVRDIVPPFVLDKPKHGFAVPTDPWFRGGLKSFAHDVLFDPKTVSRGFFETATVERLWNEHSSGRNVWDQHLWLLLNFELWHRIYLDGDGV